jgi:crossover junction endodeoxyribonuclease RuvC
MKRVLGIDPGKGGALAYLVGDVLDEVVDMPTLLAGKTKKSKKSSIDEVELARRVKKIVARGLDVAFLELVGVRPGEGPTGAFTFGRGYGVVRGILRAHFVPIRDVTPTTWKRALGIEAGAGKDASRALAKELWQEQADLFARVKDDGRAEASLIAHYGRLKLAKEAA